MARLSKSFVLTIFIIFIVAIAGLVYLEDFSQPTANVYVENNSVSCSMNFPVPNQDALEEEICHYVSTQLNNVDSNLTTVKEGIHEIGLRNGIENLNVNINSELGNDVLPVNFNVEGTSMVPTLQDGQTIIVEKTKDISVNDIVVAESPEYGTIVKRVGQIDGKQVYLVSDNKKVEYEEINGIVYETKGITTWVDISDIYGVVKSY
ncbi:MAG: S24/S26 family peptidase [Methanobrevibacter sp.]|uniref:S24/S26 family peptidase n=1 Tax=Methanobrevibacter sp. TaxID=66852 RepID=UPI0026E000DE|nr:S24/S26 family peptidase [Methanobrevibacter sp.]MDO5849118.1 S24/S26 family peptidase [Methanobrevibacter sp.]